MKRSYCGLLLAGFCLLGLPTAVAHAAPSALAKAMGNLRWGMSELEVKGALKGKTDTGQLSASHVEFDGKRSRYDGSVVGEEYTHGNDESMLAFKDKDAENYLFFIGDELWKWVKVYPSAAFKGGFAATVKKKFGKGYEKNGEVNQGSGAVYDFVEYLDRNTRLRAVDKSADAQRYVLMFESLETARSIASLRSDTIRRGTPPKKGAVAKRKVEDDDEEVTRAPAPSAPGTLASKVAKNKKSIISENENHEETADEYQARKQRMQADARDQQKRLHQRTEEAKKGKVLDELSEIEDDDPMAGMAAEK
ncbi:MAG TPA: hypothetical protein VK509_05005 [Polyangiales bacterium]|nr:hypothetical protein [Polyangiales bacterium]